MVGYFYKYPKYVERRSTVSAHWSRTESWTATLYGLSDRTWIVYIRKPSLSFSFPPVIILSVRGENTYETKFLQIVWICELFRALKRVNSTGRVRSLPNY